MSNLGLPTTDPYRRAGTQTPTSLPTFTPNRHPAAVVVGVGAGDTTVVDVGNGGAAWLVVTPGTVAGGGNSRCVAATDPIGVPPPGVEDGGRAGDDTLGGNGVTDDGVRGAVMIGAGSGGCARPDPPAPDTTINAIANADATAAVDATTWCGC
jgi:hypothetical protein